MKNIIKDLKMRLGFYKIGYSYMVKLSDIAIPIEFEDNKPKPKKMFKKREYLRRNGKYESKVVLNRNFVLVDGYTTYLLSTERDEKYVEAYFVD